VIRAIVTDIEGTTSSIAFVHDVLFPYSRARLADYVRAHGPELTEILDGVRAAAHEPDLGVEACIAQLEAWHDADRKMGPLKELQGRIWREGFEHGTFQGHVYADAVAGLRRWHAAGLSLYVYSSGSVGAQKLLFGHSVAGDLTPLFSGWFDTGVGAKRDPESYRHIAARIGMEASDILFFSDVVEELDAARAAGLATTLVARDGERDGSDHAVARSFDEVDLAVPV
jgi:enolase-phosphatase E1